MRHGHQQLGAAIAISILGISSACTVLELQQDGFATNAMYLLHALPIFLKQNGTFFLDSTAFPYTCNEGSGFMDFFLPENLIVPWSAPKELAAGEVCRRVTFAQVDDLVYNKIKLPQYQLDLVGIRTLWWYKKWVWSWIEGERLAELRDITSPSIAFHIRGGDIFEADKAQGRRSTLPADYIQAFHKTHPHIKGGTCIFLGDEAGLLDQAAEIAEKKLKCKARFGSAPVFKEGFNRARFSNLHADARCQASLQILADLEVMGRADYFVASYHSQWAKLVEWLRYGLYQKDRSSSVDASADHADLFTVIYSLFNNNNKGTAAPATEVRQAHAADILTGEAAAPKKGAKAPDSTATKAPTHKTPSGKKTPPATQKSAHTGAHAAEKSAHAGVRGGKAKEAAAEKKSTKKKKKPKVVAAQEEEPVQAKPKGSGYGGEASFADQEQREPLLAEELPLEVDEVIDECLGLTCGHDEPSAVKPIRLKR